MVEIFGTAIRPAPENSTAPVSKTVAVAGTVPSGSAEFDAIFVKRLRWPRVRARVRGAYVSHVSPDRWKSRLF